MANPGEASRVVVTQDKPKVLSQNGDSCARPVAAAKSGLGQQGMWSGPGAPNSPGADEAPPAKGRGPGPDRLDAGSRRVGSRSHDHSRE
jgi:hypothetical protein